MSGTAEAIRAPQIDGAFYTPQEVSTMTGTTERHVMNLTKRGELASVRFGHRVLIPVDLVDRLKVAAKASQPVVSDIICMPLYRPNSTANPICAPV